MKELFYGPAHCEVQMALMAVNSICLRCKLSAWQL